MSEAVKVLMISASESFFERTAAIMRDKNCFVTRADGAVGAKFALNADVFDAVIIDCPHGGGGAAFAVDIAKTHVCAVLIIVKSEEYAATYDKVSDHGVFVLKKPLSESTFKTAVDWLKVAVAKQRTSEQKAVGLNEKVIEIKIIDRAKMTLMTVLKMTEADAHRYIEKQAMDRCVTRRAVAEEILQTYK